MRQAVWYYNVALGLLSAFWAESTISSSVFLFRDPFSLLVTVPLYALHAILLAYLITWRCSPRLYIIYTAGMVFGLYEAYVTKMLFHHAWDSPQLEWIGVSWFAFPLLVFWYHPIFAFIVPLFLMELVVAGRRPGYIFIPDGLFSRIAKSPRKWLIGIGCLMGCYHSLATKPLDHMLGSLYDGLVIFAVVYAARSALAKQQEATSLRPTDRAAILCAIGLAGIFLTMGFTLRLEALPNWQGHVMVIAFYTAFLTTIIVYLKRKEPEIENAEHEPPLADIGDFAYALLAWFVVSLLFFIAPPIFGMLSFVICTLTGYLAGFAMLILWARSVFLHFRTIGS